MLLIEIHGNPCPQKQTRFVRRGSYVSTFDPSSKEKANIQWQLKAYAPREPLAGAVKVDLTFYLPVPKSTSGVRKRQMLNHVILPTKRPDVDNLAYLITNAMKSIIYCDDSQVVDLCMHKRYGAEPKTVVKIIPIEEIAITRGEECE